MLFCLSMKPIGSFVPQGKFFLAPMEAVNCASFRILCLRRGAAVVYTDMIDADVFYEKAQELGVKGAVDLLVNPQDEEKGKLVIQIGGGKLETLQFAITHLYNYAVWIDFNVGCPLGYMLGKKGGVYLQKHPEQLYRLVSGMLETCNAVGIPFSCKLRAGWDKDCINAVEVALELEKLGVSAVGIHGRTRKQRYQDKADWQLVRRVVEAVERIPVILSGDVTTAYLAQMAFLHTKCDYIMIARGAKNNPSVFSQLDGWENAQKTVWRVTYEKTAESARNDFREWLSLYKTVENRYRFSEIQDHALWCARECKNNKIVTQKIQNSSSEEELISIFDEILF